MSLIFTLWFSKFFFLHLSDNLAVTLCPVKHSTKPYNSCASVALLYQFPYEKWASATCHTLPTDLSTMSLLYPSPSTQSDFVCSFVYRSPVSMVHKARNKVSWSPVKAWWLTNALYWRLGEGIKAQSMSTPGPSQKKLLHSVTAGDSKRAIDDKSHIKSCVPLSHRLRAIKKGNMKLNSYYQPSRFSKKNHI